MASLSPSAPSDKEPLWIALSANPDAHYFIEEILLPVFIERIWIDAQSRMNPDTKTIPLSIISEVIQSQLPHRLDKEGGIRFFSKDPVRQFYISKPSLYQNRLVNQTWSIFIGVAQGGTVTMELTPQSIEKVAEAAHIYALALIEQARMIAKIKAGKRANLDNLNMSLINLSAAAGYLTVAAKWYSAKHTSPQPLKTIFTDATSFSGINFRHEVSDWANNLRDKNYMFTYAGAGVSTADYDGDRDLDLYFVSGKENLLFQNQGNCTFVNVTEKAGLSNRNESHAAYFADYDNDGDIDLYVTNSYVSNNLYQNNGDGTFTDVTLEAGVGGSKEVSTAAVFFDFNNDGWLDLYVVNFGNWPEGILPFSNNARNGQPNQLFRNNGDGTFREVTTEAGVGDTGWGLAVATSDFDNDGDQDIYIANDFGENALYENLSGGRFVDVSKKGGVKDKGSGMNVGIGDVNQDGRFDLYISNIFYYASVLSSNPSFSDARDRFQFHVPAERNRLFLNKGNMHFEEISESQMGQVYTGWAWDADFFDFDNDGELDIYVLNGHRPGSVFHFEPNILYKQKNGRFQDVSSSSGADFMGNSRGAAFADCDADGDLDIFINNVNGKAVVLRNNSEINDNGWLKVKTIGTQSNRDGVGARVTVIASDLVQTSEVRAGSGYLSQDSMELEFGLGLHSRVDRIEVRWPSGIEQRLENVPVNQVITIMEPAREQVTAEK